MALTHKQKKYIKRNVNDLSVTQIAANLQLPENEVQEYVKERWGDKKIRQHRAASSEDTGKKIEIPRTVHIRQWLKDNIGWMVLLVVLVFIAYANGLTGEFISDDIESILGNQNLPYIHYIFSPPLRIVKSIMTFLTYKIAGPHPFIFHFVNVLFHSATVVSVFVLIGLLVNPIMGFFVAALMAVHPLLVESVTWIAGGVYVQYTFVVILSLFSYLLLNRNFKKYYTYSFIFFVISMLIGPDKAIVFPVVLFSLEFVNRDLMKHWVRLIPYFAISFLVGLYYVIGGDIAYRFNELSVKYYQPTYIQNPLIQIPAALSSYWFLTIWPEALTFYHSELRFTRFEFSIRAIATMLFFLSFIYTYKKNRQLFFWLSVFFISLLPTLTPFGVAWVVAERYVYFGSIGIFFAVAYLFYYFAKNEKTKTAAFFCFTAVICALLVRTIFRNMDWQNQDTLWVSTAKYSPSDPKTHNNLGDMYARQGNWQKAINEFTQSTKLNPYYGDGYHNLANVYANIGKYDSALYYYNKALRINPGLWQTYQAIGTVYFRQEKYDTAVAYMKKALEINPNDPAVHGNLGVMYLKAGNKELALQEFNIVLQLHPGDQRALLGIEETNKLK